MPLQCSQYQVDLLSVVFTHINVFINSKTLLSITALQLSPFHPFRLDQWRSRNFQTDLERRPSCALDHLTCPSVPEQGSCSLPSFIVYWTFKNISVAVQIVHETRGGHILDKKRTKLTPRFYSYAIFEQRRRCLLINANLYLHTFNCVTYTTNLLQIS